MTIEPRRILALCLPGIGDTVMFTPALAALRRAFPRARIVALTMFTGAAELLETNPDVDEVRFFDFFGARPWQSLAEVHSLRRERFDLSVLPFPANRASYNAVNALLGHRWSAGHRYQLQSWRNLWFLNDIVVNESGQRHNVEENLALVDAICERLGVAIERREPALRVHLTDQDTEYGHRFFATHDLDDDVVPVAVHAFSSTFKNMHHKCWPPGHFADLVARSAELDPRARILLFSGPADAAVSAEIVRRAPGRALVVEEPRLRAALGILRRCRLLVSNDSGIMHVAAALGVPVVALFGPTSWRRLRPWSDAAAIVHADLPCMPCFRYSTRPLTCAARTDYACMRSITVDEVLAAARNLLARSGPGVPT